MALPIATYLISLVIFNYIWAQVFYSSTTHVGHDFGLSATWLLEAKYWLDSNGLINGFLNPPWFTPAWCAGAAFYADPQAAFYSPLTLSVVVFDPFAATHLMTLIYASVAFWASYALARKTMGWTVGGATVFGLLGMVNGFMPMRSAVGELGFQPLYLWPLLVIALCWPVSPSRWQGLWPSVCVALLLSAWFQFGFAGMMVPVFLASLAFACVLVLIGRSNLWVVVGRCVMGGLLAIVLNASKLYESASYMRQFPRDFYPMPGLASLWDAILVNIYGLLFPSQWTTVFAGKRLLHGLFAVLPHEWAMHFGLGAVAIAVIATIGIVVMKKDAAPDSTRFSLNPEKILAAFFVGCVAVLPVLLLWDEGNLRAIIKQVPILNSTAWPMRWIIVLLPMTQLLLALPIAYLFEKLPKRRGAVLIGVAIAAIWCGPLSEPVQYYTGSRFQSYDPTPVRVAHRESKSQPPVPIRSIVSLDEARGMSWGRNDTMLKGASQIYCYNPLYGYGLEKAPQIERLRDGLAFEPDSVGKTLLLNPACLIHPLENQCKPGDGFDLDDAHAMEQAKRFLDRKPFDWQRPKLARLLALISQLSWGLLGLLIGLKAVRSIVVVQPRNRG